MDRSTGFSGLIRLMRLSSAAIVIAAAILSCTDNTAPTAAITADPYTVQLFYVPDAVKQAYWASVAQSDASTSSNAMATTSAILSKTAPASLSGAISNDVAAPAYTLKDTTFSAEADPINTLTMPADGDDGYVPNMAIGFNFTFYGNTYNTLNLYLNGFVTFGVGLAKPYWQVDGIPYSGDPNNMIALAWSDWYPGRVPGSITYETRGTAPNRRFLIQFKGVPEAGGSGHVTAQLVLSEGSNEIAMFTTSMNITNSGNRVTQGIENADGTEALFDSVQLANGMWSPRSRGFYKLTNDGIKFTPTHVNQPPVVTPPANISVNTDPGVCTAAATVGVATVTDDADGSTVAGVRSDAPAALDAAYPKGVTTVTWTATDAGGLTATADQTVTVSDKQAPAVVAGANISTRTDRNASTATVAIANATATDNCGDLTATGARSDGVPLSAGYPVGVTTITWTATDASGNSGSATQTVTVVGNLPPVISAPANIAINTDPRECSAVRNPGTPVVTDDTDGFTFAGVRSDHVPDLTAAYPKGVTTIVWTATDADGLTSSASQTITVSDKEKPTIVAPANVSAVNDPGLAFAAVATGSPTVSDNCAGVSFSAARSDGGSVTASYPVGVTNVTWTATDASGNVASAAQSITVRDVELPVLTVPANLTVNATSTSGAAVTFSVGASDNVGVTSVSCSPTSGSTFPVGTTTVTCTASDAAGHSASGSFSVQVLGPSAQLMSLIQYVLSLNQPNGVTNPLVNQLQSVSPNLQGCNKMNDFLALLSKKGEGVTDGEYDYMLSEATRIMGDMGCAPPRTLKPRSLPRTVTREQGLSSVSSAATKQ
jgi:hypothetical protein